MFRNTNVFFSGNVALKIRAEKNRTKDIDTSVLFLRASKSNLFAFLAFLLHFLLETLGHCDVRIFVPLLSSLD